MEPFKVQEWAFSDFGMSVKTNFEVTLGENVKWMEVSGLEPSGSARETGLAVGDRILAIADTPVTTLGRSGLLELLFQRKRGERVRFLIMSPAGPLPRFIVLTAARP